MESTSPNEGETEQPQKQQNGQNELEHEHEHEHEKGLLLSQEQEQEQEQEENERVVVSIRPSIAAAPAPSYMGKHRLNAAITQLNHQIQIIQEELDELETLGQSSLVCRELVTAVESIPDALLPEIRGPAMVGWDRWFQGGSRARKRWI